MCCYRQKCVVQHKKSGQSVRVPARHGCTVRPLPCSDRTRTRTAAPTRPACFECMFSGTESEVGFRKVCLSVRCGVTVGRYGFRGQGRRAGRQGARPAALRQTLSPLPPVLPRAARVA